MPECKQCGECCRVLVVPFVNDSELREFLDARGIKYTVEFDRLNAVVPHVCPHLVDGLCDLHESGKKPVACDRFPGADQDCIYKNPLI